MSIKESILQYELCIMCDINLAKLGSSYCKKCKIKPIRNRFKNDGSTKIYYYKFQDKNNKARLRLVNSKSSDIGYSLCIQPSTPNTRGFRPIENSELFLLPTWNQFRSLKEFASCIIQSDQISFAYFIISCSSLIQSLPKFQHFIKTRAIDLPPNSGCQNLVLPFPLTNHLNLLCQASFWDELISIYFHEFHPMYPLFSIRSFSKKTASSTLLSAIYFCAYQFRKQRQNEISEYIEKLAAKNIMKIIKNATIDNARALVIHMFIAKLGGNLTLVKSLQAHLSRMSYLLGLHLNYNKMSSIDRYNRNLLFHVARTINIGLSGSHNFAPNYLTEYGNEDSNLYDPKWQLPNPNSPIFYENPSENQLYSLCLTNFFKFTDTSARTIWFPSFYNKEIGSFNNIWNSKTDAIKAVYEDIIQTLEELKLNYSEFRQKVESLETHVRIGYHEVMIEMYEVLKHKNKLLKPGDITNILHHCHELYKVITTAGNYSPYFQVFSHIVGLHYLNVYPKCTTAQKQSTKRRLQGLILFMKDNYLQHFSLNYLILKTGYDLLDEN